MEQIRADVVEKRGSFRRRIKKYDPDKLVVMDESGFNVAMSKKNAWVKRGSEFVEHKPINKGKNCTVLGAIRLRGIVTQNSMFNSTNNHRFNHWAATKLLPKLNRGDVLILDNLRAHHNVEFKKMCKSAGIILEYLPPYSPDFSPIEPMWSKQKNCVRKMAPRTKQKLRGALRKAKNQITVQDCVGWFRHVGLTG